MTQLNGNYSNGSNGKNSQVSFAPKDAKSAAAAAASRSPVANENGWKNKPPEFEQEVVLQRPPFFSRAMLWCLVGFTTFSIAWAAIAKIEEAIPATGKLEPRDAVKEVQVPVNGLVKELYVKDGKQVEKGDLLMLLDPASVRAQLISQTKVRDTLKRENNFYRSILSGIKSDETLKLPGISQEMSQLAKNRVALVAENRLYQNQVSGNIATGNLNSQQLRRLRSSKEKLETEKDTIRLEAGQLAKQFAQNTVRLNNAQSVLKINEEILQDLTPLFKEGAIARLQYRQQQQEVNNRQAQVAELQQEAQRLELAIAQSGKRLQNTVSGSDDEVLTRIADNEKRIAEIDTQFNKAIVDNQKRIAELDGQIRQGEVTLRYQEVRAPISGTIFDLKASEGFVANPTEPVVKVVPDQTLTAEIFLTNKDIGFVREGMEVDVRVDSYPFSEFGDIKGELISIGKDALPPDELRNYYAFPAKVRLNKQTIKTNGKVLPLQSGMSVQVNIKIRDRTILSIFTDKFTQQIESLKFVR
ncbi:MAG: HlyD family efflux transporter periplasmic adaptor subunit [Cyanobacteria bacterium P01_A01_bin.45]